MDHQLKLISGLLLLALGSPSLVLSQEGHPLHPGEIAPSAEIVASHDLSKTHIDEQQPEKSIPTPEQAMKNPLEMGYLMMDLIARGEAATQRGDHTAAVRYYAAIAKAVPDRAVAYAKMCRAYKELEQIDKALENCRSALGRGGATADDYYFFIHLLLGREQVPEPSEIKEIDEVVGHLERELGVEKPAKLAVAQLRCELATKLEDEERLSRCTQDLMTLAPQQPATFTFRWARAVKQREFDSAQKIIQEAKQAGVPASVVGEMQAKLETERAKAPAWLKLAADWRVLAGAALLATIALLLVVSRRTSSVRTA